MIEEKYLILDEEKDRKIVEELATLLIISELEDFQVAPIMVNVIEKNGEVELEAIGVSGNSVQLKMDDEMKEILKTEKDLSVAGCLIKENDSYSQVLSLDSSIEEAIYKVKYMCVESFIEFKNITSIPQLILEKGKLENIFNESYKLFEDWEKEDKIRWGLGALSGTEECPDCAGILEYLFEAETDEGDFEANVFRCTDCFEHYIVVTDPLGTVVDVGVLDENNFIDRPKAKKKKKKKTKKSFGKNKRKRK